MPSRVLGKSPRAQSAWQQYEDCGHGSNTPSPARASRHHPRWLLPDLLSWDSLHEPFPIFPTLGNAGLLKDDFAQPDSIRIPGFAPRQVSAVLTKQRSISVEKKRVIDHYYAFALSGRYFLASVLLADCKSAETVQSNYCSGYCS